jgi:hypothetical protein
MLRVLGRTGEDSFRPMWPCGHLRRLFEAVEIQARERNPTPMSHWSVQSEGRYQALRNRCGGSRLIEGGEILKDFFW